MKRLFFLLMLLAFGVMPLESQTLVWEVDLSENALLNPVVVGNRLYVGTHGGGHFFVLDTETGAEIWSRHDLNQHVAPARVQDGIVYLASDGGIVYALDAETGDERWQFNAEGPVFATPLLLDGFLYFTTATNLFIAVSAEDGTEAWRIELNTPIYGDLVYEDGRVFGASPARIYSMSVESGEILWEVAARRSFFSDPIVANGLVYVGASDGRFFALDALTGESVWEYQGTSGQGAWTKAAIDGGMVYAGNRGAGLVALDAQTGELVWQIPYDADVVFSTPYIGNDVLYFGTGLLAEPMTVGVFYAFHPQTGEVFWEYEPLSPVLVPPALDEAGHLYLATIEGGLEILETHE